MRDRLPLFIALILTSAAACKGEQASGNASASPSAAGASSGAAASEQKKEKTTCADWGGTGKGAFGDSCRLKGQSPIKARWTGKYTPDNDEGVPEIEIENTFDRKVDWGSLTVYYYDKDGKQLKYTDESGSGVLQEVAPGGKTTIKAGFEKSRTPPGTEAIEVEIHGWGWDKPTPMYFAISDYDLEVRPKGGWK